MNNVQTPSYFLFLERIGYATSLIGAVSVGMGLQNYFERHQPIVFEDYLSLLMLVGGAAMAYKSHQKRLDLEEKELQQKSTPPPYLYFPGQKSLESLVKKESNPSP